MPEGKESPFKSCCHRFLKRLLDEVIPQLLAKGLLEGNIVTNILVGIVEDGYLQIACVIGVNDWALEWLDSWAIATLGRTAQ